MRLLTFFICCVLFVRAFSQTVVSGDITTNTTWDSLNSPYTIVNNISIQSGVTLTVLPGTVINPGVNVSITVNGTLKMLGTSQAPIQCKPPATFPSPGSWGGIIVTPSAQGTVFDVNGDYLSGSIIQNARVSYGGYPAMIQSQGISLLVDSCTFHHGAFYAIYFQSGGGKAHIANCHFHNMSNGAAVNFYSNSSQKRVQYNLFENNQSGISLYSGGNANISNNRFINGGIHINASYCDSMTISYNQLINSSNMAISHTLDPNPQSSSIHHNLILNNNLSNSSSVFAKFNAANIHHNAFINNGGNIVNSNSAYFQHNFRYNLFHSNSFNPSTNGDFITLNGSLSGGTSMYLYRNLFQNNSLTGTPSAMLSTNTPYDLPYTLLENTFISNKSDYVFYNRNSGGSSISAQSNFWGRKPSAIPDVIFDAQDNSALTSVSYVPYLVTPHTSSPVPSPKLSLVYSCSDTLVYIYNALVNDNAGYKVHYGYFDGLKFEFSVDLGNITFFNPSSLSAYDTIAFTAYDNQADGVNDLVEGHESWFTFLKTDSIIKLLDLKRHNDASKCIDDTLLLNGRLQGYSYLWSTGDTTQIAPVTDPGVYSVVATSPQNYSFCDTIVISNITLPYSLVDDTTLSLGSSLYLNASQGPGFTYLWNTGITTPGIFIDSLGVYVVQILSPEECLFFDTVNVIGYTDVFDSQESYFINVFPNPATEVVHINSAFKGSFEVELCNLSGSIILKKRALENLVLDINNLDKGVYVLKLKGNDWQKTIPLVKH